MFFDAFKKLSRIMLVCNALSTSLRPKEEAQADLSNVRGRLLYSSHYNFNQISHEDHQPRPHLEVQRRLDFPILIRFCLTWRISAV